jgi:hypothetical protein
MYVWYSCVNWCLEIAVDSQEEDGRQLPPCNPSRDNYVAVANAVHNQQIYK